MELLRKCIKCGLEAHNEEDLKRFTPHKNSLHGRANICRECKTTYQRRWGKGHRDGPNYSRSRFKTKERSAQRRQYRVARRLELLKLYGGKCVCCGETIQEFLTLDHVQGDGANERKRLRNSHTIYAHAIKLFKENEAEARKMYRLLCWNCNCAIGHYGYCPHNPKKVNPR